MTGLALWLAFLAALAYLATGDGWWIVPTACFLLAGAGYAVARGNHSVTESTKGDDHDPR